MKVTEVLDSVLATSGWLWADGDHEILGLNKGNILRMFRRINSDMNRHTPLRTQHRIMFSAGQKEVNLDYLNPMHAHIVNGGVHSDFTIQHNVLHRVESAQAGTVDIEVSSHWEIRRTVLVDSHTRTRLFDVDSCGKIINPEVDDTERDDYEIPNLTDQTSNFDLYLDLVEAYLKMSLGGSARMFTVSDFPIETSMQDLASEGRELRTETITRLEDTSDIFMHLNDPLDY